MFAHLIVITSALSAASSYYLDDAMRKVAQDVRMLIHDVKDVRMDSAQGELWTGKLFGCATCRPEGLSASLNFKSEKISGSGEDEVGKFEITGIVRQNKVAFVLEYPSPHDVKMHFSGRLHKDKISGTYAIHSSDTFVLEEVEHNVYEGYWMEEKDEFAMKFSLHKTASGELIGSGVDPDAKFQIDHVKIQDGVMQFELKYPDGHHLEFKGKIDGKHVSGTYETKHWTGTFVLQKGEGHGVEAHSDETSDEFMRYVLKNILN